MKPVISATGLWTPTNSISNEELVVAFNAYVDNWNEENAAAIDAGKNFKRSDSRPSNHATYYPKT